jgi:hypothetical protein
MTTVKIDRPDDKAALLAAKAAKDGLTLEGWFQKLAEQEAPTGKSRYSLSQLVEQCDMNAPLFNEDGNGWTRQRQAARRYRCSAATFYRVDSNPIKCREQASPRYVLIVSPKAFNLWEHPCLSDHARRKFRAACGFRRFIERSRDADARRCVVQPAPRSRSAGP